MCMPDSFLTPEEERLKVLLRNQVHLMMDRILTTNETII